MCPRALTDAIEAKLVETTGDAFYRADWMERPQKIVKEQDGIVTKSVVFDWETVGD